MDKKRVLIIGSGHLAYRVRKQLDTNEHEVTYLSRDRFELKINNDSKFDYIIELLKDVNLSSLSAAYVIDDHDAFNLEIILVLISLNNKLPIIASLFNENISPHLRAAHANIKILNPAKIAAPTFVEALGTPVKRFLRYKPAKPSIENASNTSDNLLSFLLILFPLVILASLFYFHFVENLSWINSLYFIVVTITTVGYGDVNLLNSSALSKVVDIVLILSSTFFIWMIFSLTIDKIIKKRTQRLLGRKIYTYKNHVILCGLGRLGYFIGEELLLKGEKIIIIEKNENSPYIDYFRNRNVDVYIGDARLPRVLQDVAVTKAKAVMSVINDDYINLEIGLNARSFDPKLHLILRIFDESMSQKIRENLDIHLAFSMSAFADEKFIEALEKN